MSEKVILSQPKVFEYDLTRIQEYLDYNFLQIMEFLRLSIDQKRMSPGLEKTLCELFVKISKDVKEFSGIMVFINKRDMIISKVIHKDSPCAGLLKFEITYGRICAGNILLKIADYFMKIRKKNDSGPAQIDFAMQDIVTAIESLPRQNFYATFSGIKNPIE